MSLLLHKFYPVAGVGLSHDIPALGAGSSVWIGVILYFSMLLAGLAANLVFFSKTRCGASTLRQRMAAVLNRPWTWREAGILLTVFLFIYLLLQLFNTFADTQFLGDLGGSASFVDIMNGVVIYTFGTALVLWSVSRRKLSCDSAFGASMKKLPRSLGQGVLFYATVLPYVFIVSIAFQIFLRVTGRDTGLQYSMKIFLNAETPFELWSFLALAVIGAPVFEELVFRGVLFPITAKKTGVGAAVIISSALFAAVHLHFASFAPLFVLSIGFSLAYIYTGSVLVPVVMHSLFNSVNLGLLLLFAGR